MLSNGNFRELAVKRQECMINFIQLWSCNEVDSLDRVTLKCKVQDLGLSFDFGFRPFLLLRVLINFVSFNRSVSSSSFGINIYKHVGIFEFFFLHI